MSRNGDDDDSSFLELVLDQLYDFGKGAAGKKKHKKRKRCEEEEAPPADGDSREDNVSQPETPCETSSHTGAAAGSVRPESRVQVVIFQDPRKKQRSKRASAAPKEAPTPPAEEKQQSMQEDLSLEKARLEVHRFGITGYKKEQQREFEQERAIMLGARPPKKEYVNYKQLQQRIKEKKMKAKEEVDPDLKDKKKKKKIPRDKKAAPAGPGSLGQVGHFKNGMLILSSKEVQKMKNTVRRK